MALIKCPECGKDISSRVHSCPHCGYPMSEEVDHTPAHPVWDSHKKNNLAAAICPNCGGELEVDPETAETRCIYCGSTILVKEALTRVVLDNATAINNLLKAASIFFKAGDFEEAEKRYTRIFELDPDNYEALLWKGICTQKSDGNTIEMLKYIDLARKIYEGENTSEKEIRSKRNDFSNILLDAANDNPSAVYYAFKLLTVNADWADPDTVTNIRKACSAMKALKNGTYLHGAETLGEKNISGDDIAREITRAEQKIRSIEATALQTQKELEDKTYWSSNQDLLRQKLEQISCTIDTIDNIIDVYLEKNASLVEKTNTLENKFQNYRFTLKDIRLSQYDTLFSNLADVLNERVKLSDRLKPTLNHLDSIKKELLNYLSFIKEEKDISNTNRLLERINKCKSKIPREGDDPPAAKLSKIESVYYIQKKKLIIRLSSTVVLGVSSVIILLLKAVEKGIFNKGLQNKLGNQIIETMKKSL